VRRILVNAEESARSALAKRLVVFRTALARFDLNEPQLGHQDIIEASRTREIANASIDVIVTGEALRRRHALRLLLPSGRRGRCLLPAADRLLRSFARARVRLGALSAHGQTAPVTKTAIAPDVG